MSHHDDPLFWTGAKDMIPRATPEPVAPSEPTVPLATPATALRPPSAPADQAVPVLISVPHRVPLTSGVNGRIGLALFVDKLEFPA